MTVFCDNGDCCYIGEDGLCGCDKLIIVGGVCAGSYRSGRNACGGDVDERLKAENAKLIVKLNVEHIARQNVEVENVKLREMLQRTWDAFHDATSREFVTVKNELRELGVKVDG